MNGPFDTEQEAQRAVHEFGAEYSNNSLLTSAIEHAGITLGAYDRRIVEWLTMWEPATCAVIAGIITRAHAAGEDPGTPGTAQRGGGWISGPST